MDKVTEGKAEVIVRDGVFFNPKMGKLRDMSVSFLKAAGNGKGKLLDCTAATGIRGIRYALEAGYKDVTLLDMNKLAYKSAAENAKRNKLRAKVLNLSLQEFANTTDDRFDVIDLDPFGSPAPNVYDMMKIVRDDALLMVTATDTAVLCGAHQAACIKTYNAKPLHSELCHETGTRILIGFILKNAMQFNYGIETLVSLSDMHYMRVFLRVKHGAEAAARSAEELGFGAFCGRCKNFVYAKGMVPALGVTCDNCGSRMDLFGPLWLGRLNDKGTLEAMIENAHQTETRRLIKDLLMELDIPLFYSIPKVTKSLGIGAVSPAVVAERLAKKGFSVSYTHFEKDSLKTDAKLKDVIRAVSGRSK